MKFYSMRQAAKEAGIAYSTLHYWLYTGAIRFPANKVGSRYVYTEAEVACLKKQRKGK